MSAITDIEPVPAQFPARTTQASGQINGVDTDVMVVSFADKILVTISQSGRFGHWVHVPLDTSASPDAVFNTSPDRYNDELDPDMPSSDLLPSAHLTATTILGGRDAGSSTIGELLASQVGSAIKTKQPEEGRLLVLGVGLEKGEAVEKEAFAEILDLVLSCL